MIAAHGSTFGYSYVFGNGVKVTGSFDGIANGNLIADISNPTVFFDGVTIDTGYGVIAEGIPSGVGSAVEGAAQVSIDGTQNNFIFIVKEPKVGAFFWDIPPFSVWGANTIQDFTHTLAIDSYFNSASWIVSDISPIKTPDDGATIVMLSLALGGSSFANRRLRIKR